MNYNALTASKISVTKLPKNILIINVPITTLFEDVFALFVIYIIY